MIRFLRLRNKNLLSVLVVSCAKLSMADSFLMYYPVYSDSVLIPVQAD